MSTIRITERDWSGYLVIPIIFYHFNGVMLFVSPENKLCKHGGNVFLVKTM